MGVISTGAIFKTLTFDGRSSSEFNVYITGEGVFNAPERAVEMISIPGRNGAFALDYGRFENIEVTYNCGIAGDDDADFASAISDFRNWLCSRNGYVRLSDDYNAGEYRMAVYKSGLEVTAENLKAGEFPVVFECKPQRFLTSGEYTISVTSGDTITNPTLFDSRPMLEVYGVGKININSETIDISSSVIGDVILAESESQLSTDTATQTFSGSIINTGDVVTLGNTVFRARVSVTSGTLTNATIGTTTNASATILNPMSKRFDLLINTDTTTLSKGTSTSITGTVEYSFTHGGTTYTHTITSVISYDGNETITYSVSDSPTTAGVTCEFVLIRTPEISAYSTKYANGNPMYIDLDIGEAWNEDYGDPVSVNNSVTMPAELPTLAPGANTITYDNTITQLDIVPRWWKI